MKWKNNHQPQAWVPVKIKIKPKKSKKFNFLHLNGYLHQKNCNGVIEKKYIIGYFNNLQAILNRVKKLQKLTKLETLNIWDGKLIKNEILNENNKKVCWI